MGFFPTKEAIDLAKGHCSKGSRYYHKDIAEEVFEAGIHRDDWTAAAIKVCGLDVEAEDNRTLEYLADIDQVADEILGLVPRKERRDPFTKAALAEVYGEED